MRRNESSDFRRGERLYRFRVSIKNYILTVTILSILLACFPLSLASSNLLAFAASSPPSVNLPLEWSASPKNTGSLIGALAAKLIPNSVGLQIVVTGGSSVNDVDWTNSHGSITCLNGTNGNVIWQVDGYAVSIHQPFQIVDLYNDGSYKIVVALWNQTVVLNGIDGSVNWTSIAPSGNTFPAIADVNGDGFLEIFVSSGNGPYRGSDWITMLGHDGTILHQAYTWHPCYGGLTVGDPKGDGNFVLFAADRSYTYVALNDSYKGGGLGIRAFDADTLTPLWNYPIGFSSSHLPILADVDGDGVLDVIVGNEGNDGIDVLNAANGTILGGRTGSTNMPAHLQPTVADLDRDGHLEFLDCNASQPKIWDLYAWTSNGALFDELGKPLITEEPPKVGNVTGGRYPDIIASAMADTNLNPYTNQYNRVYIYEYNTATGKYAIVATLINQLHRHNNFSLVADVDGDGSNELVLTGGGAVYAYGTPVPTPAKPARSNLQFYSECNRGVAEYVAPPIPTKPVLMQEQPLDDSVNQPLGPTLSTKVVDYQKQTLTIKFSSNASGTWQDIKTYANVQSGIYNVSTSNMGNLGTTYYWRVTATNSKGLTAFEDYRFTTYSPLPTQADPILIQDAGVSGEDLRASTTSSSINPTTNIYSWYKDGVPLANLQLPFDSYTSTNPLLLTELLSDGFENGLGNWDIASSNWDLITSQPHAGSYSMHAGTGSHYLISKPIDLSTAESVTISFWYRTNGSPEAYFALWNGKWWDYLVNLGSTSLTNEWHYYSVQTYDPRYLNSSLLVAFDSPGSHSTSLSEVWLDDFQISTQTKTRDYSGNNLNATIHGATWSRQGISGGAYNFNGVNNLISVPNTPLTGGNATWSQITVGFWVKPSYAQNGGFLLAKKVASEQTGSYMVGFERYGSPNTLYWGITSTNDNGWHEVGVNTSLPVGTWSYVACTYKSGQGLTIFVNGIQRANLSLSGNIALGPDPFAPMTSVFGQPLFMGSDGSFNSNSWFGGLIDEVEIYPIALTSPQILQKYNEVIGSTKDSTISYLETRLGEIWASEVTPNDGFSDGLPQFTNPVRVGYSSVVWNLTVSSTHGSPNPAVGISAYNHGTSITASVDSPVNENNYIWECTGWTGTGSVPKNGSGLSTTFVIKKESSITWNWVLKSSPQPNPGQVAIPTFSPHGGTYPSAQTISISCGTVGSTIRYTLNGDEPTSTSTLYSDSIQINNGTVAIKAKAFANGLQESNTAIATYTIQETNLTLTVISAHGNPTPVGGIYIAGQSVTAYVSSPVTENATIWTCTGWTGTGSVPKNGSETSVTFILTQDSTITWNWFPTNEVPAIPLGLYALITIGLLSAFLATGLLLRRKAK